MSVIYPLFRQNRTVLFFYFGIGLLLLMSGVLISFGQIQVWGGSWVNNPIIVSLMIGLGFVMILQGFRVYQKFHCYITFDRDYVWFKTPDSPEIFKLDLDEVIDFEIANQKIKLMTLSQTYVIPYDYEEYANNKSFIAHFTEMPVEA
jgi:hypothetical protein